MVKLLADNPDIGQRYGKWIEHLPAVFLRLLEWRIGPEPTRRFLKGQCPPRLDLSAALVRCRLAGGRQQDANADCRGRHTEGDFGAADEPGPLK
jgi:hypothetical protein